MTPGTLAPTQEEVTIPSIGYRRGLHLEQITGIKATGAMAGILMSNLADHRIGTILLMQIILDVAWSSCPYQALTT